MATNKCNSYELPHDNLQVASDASCRSYLWDVVGSVTVSEDGAVSHVNGALHHMHVRYVCICHAIKTSLASC